ncbi:Na+/H+ antiporter NhaA [Thermus oshimai]|uniref:Na+/H+ antiporter NhaA n=1 Tax=Thermus oshimai TaxID=56957 RepID=UPI00035EF225|nr:Na+/H+ antiporter NhaA [Thermus oshimai]
MRFPKLLDQFLESESKGGVLLFLAALIAFLVANSPLSPAYFGLKETPLGVGVGDWKLEKPLVLWINDLLMAFFFLLVGLEIKRELLQGELKDPRRAGLAVAAALGGMVAPALVYLAFNWGGEGLRGWGVPMATDIAFALGVLALLGSRVPLALKVFLTALAIVDDLGAVLVIALFYTETLNLGALGWAALFLGLAFLANRLGVRALPVYMVLGLFLWYFTLKSGVHATLAGVLLALAVPLTRALPLPELHQELREMAHEDPEALEGALEGLEASLARAQSPLHRLEHLLHPWVAYLVLPLFAFFNAGVALEGVALGPVALGAFFGLLLGKPLGILLFAFLAVKSGLAQLPEGVGWKAILGVGFLAGIGFTMALFIAALAFPSPSLLDQAKLGVLSASLVAALLGLGLTYLGARKGG